MPFHAWGVWLSANTNQCSEPLFHNKGRKQKISDNVNSAKNQALPALPRTLTILCLYSSFSFSRAGPRYLRGSNSPGCSTKTLRIAAVIARRPSLSILILQTADPAALLNWSSDMPAVFHFPPYLFISSTISCGTDEAPCKTIGNGIRLRTLREYRTAEEGLFASATLNLKAP